MAAPSAQRATERERAAHRNNNDGRPALPAVGDFFFGLFVGGEVEFALALLL